MVTYASAPLNWSTVNIEVHAGQLAVSAAADARASPASLSSSPQCDFNFDQLGDHACSVTLVEQLHHKRDELQACMVKSSLDGLYSNAKAMPVSRGRVEDADPSTATLWPGSRFPIETKAAPSRSYTRTETPTE
jgi:hypothetical protein